MNPQTALAVAALIIAVIAPLANFLRSAMTHGAVIQRLATLENWQSCKSIDRNEFEDHGARIGKLESEMETMTQGLHRMEVMMERLVASSEGTKELFAEKLENLGHKVSGLKMVVEGYIGPAPVVRPRSRASTSD